MVGRVSGPRVSCAYQTWRQLGGSHFPPSSYITSVSLVPGAGPRWKQDQELLPKDQDRASHCSSALQGSLLLCRQAPCAGGLFLTGQSPAGCLVGAQWSIDSRVPVLGRRRESRGLDSVTIHPPALTSLHVPHCALTWNPIQGSPQAASAEPVFTGHSAGTLATGSFIGSQVALKNWQTIK